ncbi:L-type lectin-domain containing receptor kinase IX.2-like [Phoenix dactylifera]|uniref:non-specific serine/threonine protein kinase n=1 Tax=Phoenix dactylifera TaxID=42345 RepID=A0A8B8ZGR0_PHODC|nr:L-type lectin-domain containing receptor kinase IX.2-like [Phoenix dactylifera]
MIYQRDAFFDDSIVQLTKNQADINLKRSSGRMVYPEPVTIYDEASVINFTSCFSFFIYGFKREVSADGLAFFLSSYPSAIPDLSCGGTLGLFTSPDGNKTLPSTVVAVEFDTFFNPQYKDISANHIGIDVHTIYSVVQLDLKANMRENTTFNACVNYRATTKNLSVFLSNASDPTRNWSLSHVVDLRKVLPAKVAVGFTAATGNKTEQHSLVSWNFSSSDLSSQGYGSSPSPTPRARHHYIFLEWLGIGAVVLLCGLGLMWFMRQHSCKKGDRGKKEVDVSIDSLINVAFERGSRPRRFPYRVLESAAKNFMEEEKLGGGGFGEVYKGVLHDSQLEVAIKRISRGSRQGKKEYISEVTIISRLRHRNLVQLIGYCHEKGDLLLVYEYMPNKSLNYHLYKNTRLLAWPERYKIALGLASALLYLHEGWEQCVIHRDVKPSNVMLDSGFNAKLGDFGLAKLMNHDSNRETTVLAGTMGYIAPEYAITGKASKEADVYSFGVVILEIACGRKPSEVEKDDQENLAEWVWELYGNGRCLAAADRRLDMKFDEQQMVYLMVVGLWCAHPDRNQRPTMRQAINVLKFDTPLPALPPNMPIPMFHSPPRNVPAPPPNSESCSIV